jgi:hypothetical protein
MNVKLIGAAFFVATLIVGTPAVAASLSGKDISALVSGKSANWKSTDGKLSGTIRWSTNGSLSVTGNFGKFSSDNGKWRVDGNKLCTKWNKLKKGAESCNSIMPLNDRSYKMGNFILSMK